MKDVASCDKLRDSRKQALIRRFPNGATHRREPVFRDEFIVPERETG